MDHGGMGLVIVGQSGPRSDETIRHDRDLGYDCGFSCFEQDFGHAHLAWMA